MSFEVTFEGVSVGETVIAAGIWYCIFTEYVHTRMLCSFSSIN